eukprot:scaffold2262_cov312-Prasinococcus_capsulatus_cf.AAC.5
MPRAAADVLAGARDDRARRARGRRDDAVRRGADAGHGLLHPADRAAGQVPGGDHLAGGGVRAGAHRAHLPRGERGRRAGQRQRVRPRGGGVHDGPRADAPRGARPALRHRVGELLAAVLLPGALGRPQEERRGARPRHVRPARLPRAQAGLHLPAAIQAPRLVLHRRRPPDALQALAPARAPDVTRRSDACDLPSHRRHVRGLFPAGASKRNRAPRAGRAPAARCPPASVAMCAAPRHTSPRCAPAKP